MAIRYIDEIKDLKGKRVFIRVDFNVPQDDSGAITEDTRISGAVPTIKYALEQGAKVVALTAKDKLAKMLAYKLQHGISFSAEKADKCTKEDSWSSRSAINTLGPSEPFKSWIRASNATKTGVLETLSGHSPTGGGKLRTGTAMASNPTRK